MTRAARALLLAIVAATAVLVPTSAASAPASAPVPVWVFGDSIPAGIWLADPATQSWPAQLDTALGAGQQVRNLGVGGMAVAYTDSASPQRMDRYVLDQLAAVPADQLPRVVLLAGGINDLIRSTDVGPTRTAIYDLVNRIGQLYPSVRVQVLTLTPYRSDAGYADPLSQRRATVNTWLRAMYGPTGQLVDVGDILTAAPPYADVRFYVDFLHPNAAGDAQLADGVLQMLTQRGLVP